MSKEKKQLEIPALSPTKVNAELYYFVDGDEEVVKVRALQVSDVLHLRSMFNAHRIIIENYE